MLGIFVFQSSGKPSRFSKDRVHAVLGEESDGIVRVLVEIRVENALIHEVFIIADVEKNPFQVVQLQWSQEQRIDSAIAFSIVSPSRASRLLFPA